jgi:glutamine---fructose-6-phosphate transaminase (isomerizing)
VVAIASEGIPRDLKKQADHVISIPRSDELLLPDSGGRAAAAAGLPHRDPPGCDVDQPRNLAKSVTVE